MHRISTVERGARSRARGALALRVLLGCCLAAACCGVSAVRAQDASEPADAQAPRLFLDAGMRGKLWASSGELLLGPSLGLIVRPFDKCVHFSAELFTGFADFDAPVVGDGHNQLYALSLGALWGNGDADHWMGAGAVLEGGYARLGAGATDDDGFGLDLSLRAQLRHRLRKRAWVFVDLRLGHALVAREIRVGAARLAGQAGPVIGLAIGGSIGP